MFAGIPKSGFYYTKMLSDLTQFFLKAFEEKSGIGHFFVAYKKESTNEILRFDLL